LKHEQFLFRRTPLGFTLIELMIVMVVIAVLLTLAIPPILTWMRQSGVQHAADQLSMDMQRSRWMAIKHHANCSISFNHATNRYTISLNNQAVELSAYRGGVQFTNDPEASVDIITFTPQGLCNPSGAVHLTNQNKERVYRIRATSAGGISRRIWNGSKWI